MRPLSERIDGQGCSRADATHCNGLPRSIEETACSGRYEAGQHTVDEHVDLDLPHGHSWDDDCHDAAPSRGHYCRHCRPAYRHSIAKECTSSDWPRPLRPLLMRHCIVGGGVECHPAPPKHEEAENCLGRVADVLVAIRTKSMSPRFEIQSRYPENSC